MPKESLIEKALANFDMKYYFKMAAGLMGIIAIGSTYSAIVGWSTMDLGFRVSRIASIMFNLLLVWLFVYLYHTTPSTKVQPIDEATQTELKELGFYDE